jgi:PAS domain S-box-containing protein
MESDPDDAERRSRVLVDSIPGLVALLSADGHVAFVNRQILEYTGRSLDELAQWGTNDIVHPDDRAGVLDTFTQAIASGRPYQIAQRLRRSDGVYCWFENRGFPLRESDGRIVRWCVLLTDIDERKRAEQALHDSERESRLAIDSIPGLVAAFTPTGEVEFVNRQIREYFGQTPEELKRWATGHTTHPDDLAHVVEVFTRSIESGDPFEMELRARRFDGVYRWFQSRGFPLRDARGNIVRWYNLLIDVDERKRAADALRASELNLRQLTETIPEMLWRASPEGAVDYCNARFLEYTGFSADAVMGDRWQQTIHPDDAARVAPIWMACVATGAEYRVEVRTFHAADRTWRWCAVTALPLCDEHGNILKWHGTIVDMHDWKQAQDDLRTMQAALAHATRVATIGELSASIAHEVNQPLSGILINANTCLRMLAADPPDLDGARDTARRTIRDANRASAVVERLRALFRKPVVATDAVDLNDAIREVIALSASDLHRHQVILRQALADDLPLVTGDRVQLQQVVLNLMMNAAEAMSGVDGRPRELRITTGPQSPDHVCVTVQDTGAGFPREGAEQLFEPFYTTKSSGMGMGLSISRSIITRHQGRLWASLNEGPGATFAFSLPVTPADATLARSAAV